MSVCLSLCVCAWHRLRLYTHSPPPSPLHPAAVACQAALSLLSCPPSMLLTAHFHSLMVPSLEQESMILPPCMCGSSMAFRSSTASRWPGLGPTGPLCSRTGNLQQNQGEWGCRSVGCQGLPTCLPYEPAHVGSIRTWTAAWTRWTALASPCTGRAWSRRTRSPRARAAGRSTGPVAGRAQDPRR